MSNIVIANFINNESTITEAIWQWNYGQVLRIQGISLPRAAEVHFAIDKLSITRIGVTTDDVTDVAIPDAVLEKSGKLKAYVYLHTGQDDGETEYEITIPIKARAEPEAHSSEEEKSALAEAIELLNSDLQITAENRQATEEAKEEAVQAKSDAESARDSAQQERTAAEDARTGSESARDSANEILTLVRQQKQDIQDAAQDAVEDISTASIATERRIESANKAAEDLEATIGAIGFYIDEDGDICQ